MCLALRIRQSMQKPRTTKEKHEHINKTNNNYETTTVMKPNEQLIQINTKSTFICK